MEISVVLRNTTPVFSAAAGISKITLDGKINQPSSRYPLTRARTMSVIADSGDGILKPVALPVVPGNTMRNLLRRIMLKSVIEKALAPVGKLSISAYSAAYAGSANGTPDGLPSTFDEIVAQRNHLFIGLFGGGPRMLEGRLKVDTLYPIHKNAERVMGDGFEDRMVEGKITDIVWTRRCDPIVNLGDDADVEVIEGGADAANGWIADLLATTNANSAKRKKGEDAPEAEEANSPRGLKAFNAHEVVIPGVNWLWRVSLDQPTDAQVGLVLLAISKLPEYRIAGGHAKDYGAVEIEDVLLNGESVWSAGTLSDDVSDYLDQMVEATDGISTADFESFAASAKEA